MIGPVLLAAGGAGVFAIMTRAQKTVEAVERAVEYGGGVEIRATRYWPYAAKTDKERKMEGKPVDRKGRPLHTLEQHRADKVEHPFVSLAGDPAIWPYGQLVRLPDLGSDVVGRVVDTGGNFMGKRKIVRSTGKEPIDVCVDSKTTKVPEFMTIYIVKGDSFEPGRAVAESRLGKPNITGYAVLGASLSEEGAFDATDVDVAQDAADAAWTGRTTATDFEALSRAVESCCQGGSLAEQQAVAWACRNRATYLGVSLSELIAPEGEYDPQGSGGRHFVSSRLAPTATSESVARAVLNMPEAADPTRGAVDFWRPADQAAWKTLADAYCAAVDEGDPKGIEVLGAYANCTASPEDVRAAFQAVGLRVCGVVGDLELLCAG